MVNFGGTSPLRESTETSCSAGHVRPVRNHGFAVFTASRDTPRGDHVVLVAMIVHGIPAVFVGGPWELRVVGQSKILRDMVELEIDSAIQLPHGLIVQIRRRG